MRKTRLSTCLQTILSVICALALLFSLTACGKTSDQNTNSQDSITITVDVVDDKAETETFTITTKEETLRGALEQEKLVEGEESEYGLFVKTVNGVTADYDTDGAYWAFYQYGEYLSSGVDTTMIADGDHYEIVYTK